MNEKILRGLREAIEWIEAHPDDEVIGIRDDIDGRVVVHVYEPTDPTGFDVIRNPEAPTHVTKPISDVLDILWVRD